MNMEYANPKETAIGSVINNLSTDAHITSVNHGFYYDIERLIDKLAGVDQPELVEIAKRNFVLSQLSKISGEVGEAVSAIQHNEPYELWEEMADVVIRLLDLAAYIECPIGDVIIKKMAVNENRPYLHGKVC